MRIKSTPRKSCLAAPYTIPKQTLAPKRVTFGKTEVREAPGTSKAAARSVVLIVPTPQIILQAAPPELKISNRALLSAGLGVGVVMCKTAESSGLMTYCYGKKQKKKEAAINVQSIDRSQLEAALEVVGVNTSALEKYEKVAADDLQDRRE